MSKIHKIWHEVDNGWSMYAVGNLGVTAILPKGKNGQCATVTYFEIYKGDNLFAELHEITGIEYEENINEQS